MVDYYPTDDYGMSMVEFHDSIMVKNDPFVDTLEMVDIEHGGSGAWVKLRSKTDGKLYWMSEAALKMYRKRHPKLSSTIKGKWIVRGVGVCYSLYPFFALQKEKCKVCGRNKRNYYMEADGYNTYVYGCKKCETVDKVLY